MRFYVGKTWEEYETDPSLPPERSASSLASISSAVRSPPLSSVRSAVNLVREEQKDVYPKKMELGMHETSSVWHLGPRWCSLTHPFGPYVTPHFPSTSPTLFETCLRRSRVCCGPSPSTSGVCVSVRIMLRSRGCHAARA